MNGLYEVSNIGNVRSIDRYVKAKGNNKKFMKGKMLKKIYNHRGYDMVDLSKNANRRKIFVHRLVAEAFIENTKNFSQVNHINEDKKDNKVENLEWCNNKYNCNYGTRNKRVGEKVKLWREKKKKQ